MSEPYFTDADRSYLRANFLGLDEVCAERDEDPAEIRRSIEKQLLPQPSYVVDGRGLYPGDYFRLHDDAGGTDRLRQHFDGRYRAAAREHPQLATEESVNTAWNAYLSGVWGQCLRQVTPETIVRKRALVDSLCKLITLPCPSSREWTDRLRVEVEELDELEREFAPDYDRDPRWNERLPTRDLLIEGARARFPDVFAGRKNLVGV